MVVELHEMGRRVKANAARVRRSLEEMVLRVDTNNA